MTELVVSLLQHCGFGQRLNLCMQGQQVVNQVKIVLVSPLRRALETAQVLFAEMKPQPWFVVVPELAEILSTACDIGRGYFVMEDKKFKTFDFSRMGPVDKQWNIENLFNQEKKAMLYSLAETAGTLTASERSNSHKMVVLLEESLRKYLSHSIIESREDFENRCEKAIRIIQDYSQNHLVDRSRDLIAVVSHARVLAYINPSEAAMKNAEFREIKLPQRQATK